MDGMLRPAAYPHPAQDIRVLETHISRVYLAGAFAYKVKKPVRLPFLDFSTLAAREHFCREELRVNARAAPGLYLDVVPLGGEPLAVGGTPAIDYAVRMRRFAQEALLGELAAQGRLRAAHADALAVAVARLHADAAVAPADTPYGTPEAIRAAAEANFGEIAALAPRLAAAPAFATLRAWTARQGFALAPRFAARRAEGHVRECHGDLHLGNVVLIAGAPVPFDAIEFDPALRWIDPVADAAFTSMDFARRGLPQLAARFIDRYLSETGDYAGLALWRYYAVYRAMVRAKVACVRMVQARQAAERGAAEAEALQAIALAARLARPDPPLMVLMHGVSGSGKTTASQRLLEQLGAVRVRSDVERKRLHGVAVTAHGGAAPGAGLYAGSATDRTYAALAEAARQVLEAGYPVVVDATFLEHRRREQLLRIAAAAHAACEIVSCEAPAEALRARVAARHARGDDASDADLAVLERQLAAREPLGDEERRHAIVLDTTWTPAWERTLDSFARRLRPAEGP